MARTRVFLPAVGLMVVGLTALPASGGPLEGSTESERLHVSSNVSDVHEPEQVPRQLIVRFEEGVDAAERAAVNVRLAARVVQNLLLPRTQLVEIEPGLSLVDAIAAYERNPSVMYAEPNVIRRLDVTTPDDPMFGDLWGLDNTGQTVNGTAGTADADIDAPEAWDTTTGSSAVVVGVADSGIAYDHPDVAGNIWANPGETGGGKETNGIDDDGNGLIDDYRGWDWVDGDNDPRDDNGHGTHVAGAVGAVGNNSTGITGVNWDVSLAPLKICDLFGSCPTSAIVNAFVYAGQMGLDVVNGSFSGPASTQSESDAISAAPDTLFVFAAGNGGADGVGDDDDIEPQYPCSFPLGNVLCVAATTQDDALASFSNYGATTVDLGAPGTNVRSTVPDFDVPFSDDFEVDFSQWVTGGTSSWTRAGTTNHFMTDGQFLYSNNTDSWAQTASSFDLSAREGCRLDYEMKLDASGGDFLRVEMSTDAVNWTVLKSWTGTTSGQFLSFTEDVTAFDGDPDAYLRYHLVTNATGQNLGADIDNISVSCVSTDGVYVGDEYVFLDGTSMATPHVAGGVALLRADTPGATLTEVRNAILAGVDPLPALATTTASGGRLNLSGALAALGVSSAVHRLTVVKRGPGTGTVSSLPAGISCPPDCTEDYSPGTMVTLSAAVTDLSEFVEWKGGGCSGTGTCEVTMNGIRHVEAFFTTPWPTFQHDAGHSGHTMRLGAQSASVQWTFPTALSPATPVVGADGTIYLPAGKQSESPNGTLYAINPNGTQQWAFALPGYAAPTTPAIGTDGTIYVHNRGTGGVLENVVAVNPNGTQKWVYESSLGFDTSTYAPPAVDRDGSIWVGFFDTALRRLNPADGSVACEVSPSLSSIGSSAAISPDGTVYVVDASGSLFAIDQDCSVKWDYDVDGSKGSPAIASDGTVWVGSDDAFAATNYLYAINPNGTLKCQAPTNDPIPSTPAIAADGTVYAVSDGLYSIDPTDCSPNWVFAPTLSGNSSSSPVVDGGGTIYWRTGFNEYAVNPNGTQKWSTPVGTSGGQALDPSAVIGSNGTIYLADGSGGGSPRLRALGGPVQDTTSAATYTVTATPGDDTITVQDGPVVSGFQTVEILAGGVTYDLANKTAISVNGGGGSDTITVDNPTPAVGVSSITVNGEGDDDSAHVAATAAGIATTVNTGAGAGDDVDVGSTLNGIAGDLDVSDAGDGGSATLDDSSDTDHNVATLAYASPVTSFTGASPGSIDLSGIASISITFGSSGDTLRVVGSDPSVSYDIHLGGGKDTFGLKGSATLPGTPVDGGIGTDTLKYLQYGSGVTADLSMGTATGTPGVAGFENIIGSNFHDSLTGSAGANLIQGSAGGDDMFGLGGVDTFEGTSLSDVVSGGDGNDLIQGKGGNDTLMGDAGNDGMGGGPGADTVAGGDGNDQLKVKDGVSGNDSADGGDGTDTCTADSGDTVLNCEG